MNHKLFFECYLKHWSEFRSSPSQSNLSTTNSVIVQIILKFTPQKYSSWLYELQERQIDLSINFFFICLLNVGLKFEIFPILKDIKKDLFHHFGINTTFENLFEQNPFESPENGLFMVNIWHTHSTGHNARYPLLMVFKIQVNIHLIGVCQCITL